MFRVLLSGAQHTVRLIPCDLCSSGHSELSVLAREGDAEGEGCVGDVVVEVVLLPDRHSLHVVHVHFHRQSVVALLLVDHLLSHLTVEEVKESVGIENSP